MSKTRFAFVPSALFVAALALAGCGDGSSGSGSSDLAGLVPPRSALFIEATIQPEGELKANVEAVTRRVAGIGDLGELIASELEGAASEEGESLDFAKEMEPWLDEKGAYFYEGFDGEDFIDGGLLLPSTDEAATRAFIDSQVENNDDPVERGSYRGVDYWVDSGDGAAIGLLGDVLLSTENRKVFERAVDASEDDSLADQEKFDEAISAATEGSLVDVYVDVGTLIEENEEEIDAGVLSAVRGAGVDADATVVASILPGPDRVEIEVTSEAGEQEAPRGVATELLGSLPGDSFAALAFSGFGEQLREAIDEIDAEGIPGEIPPGGLKSGASELGFDLDEIAFSLDDAGLFATGSSESDVGGAFVLTTTSGELATVVKTFGALVGQSGESGVTALSGRANGFSVRDPEEIGPQPAVVATRGDRVAIGYGVGPTLRGLAAEGAYPLSENPDYEAAVAALGSTPISGFVDGPGALRLADSFISSSEEDFEQAKPFLRKIRFVAIGSGRDGDHSTARLIAGLEE
jgi:Protein of unknown function (DUF3352)